MTEAEVDVPFIIVPGSIGEERAVAMLRSGAHGFVLNLSRLVPAVERAVHERQLRAELLERRRQAERDLQELVSADPAVGQVRAMIERQVDHMVRLIDDLLDVARISRGKILLEEHPMDLVALVRTVVEDTRSSLEARSLTIEVDLPPGPLPIVGDVTRLSQVVGNLLNNAGKFTDPGGRIHLALAATPGASEANLVVEDTGAGMDAEILPRVFDVFTQADRSLDRSRGGIGLGLSLVKTLVEMHRGTVRARERGARPRLAVHRHAAARSARAPARTGCRRRADPEGGGPQAPRAPGRGQRRRRPGHADGARAPRPSGGGGGHRERRAGDGEGLPAGDRPLRHRPFRRDGRLRRREGPPRRSGAAIRPPRGADRLRPRGGRGQALDAGFAVHLPKPVEPAVLHEVIARLCAAG
jgi:signal transduction histidine kinase